MRYSPKQYAGALYESLHEAHGEAFSFRVKQFLTLLKKAGALKLLPQILVQFEKIEREATGKELVRLAAVSPVSGEDKEQLEGIFPKSEVMECVDKGLLGGLVIEWDDFRVDGSVRGRLAKLRSVLTK